ncbi:transposase [Paraburkholderia dilworthii]|uniref:transposase n=1 Tax=Paraburkholderia dilworthii TaxID=948106 RepID=UPI003899152D
MRQWVLSLPIALRVLLAAQPELVTPVLQVVQRVVRRHLLDAAGLKAGEGHGGAVTLIQRFGSAANLNIHLHRLVLDGLYRNGADGVPDFVEVGAPTDEELPVPGANEYHPSRSQRRPAGLDKASGMEGAVAAEWLRTVRTRGNFQRY